MNEVLARGEELALVLGSAWRERIEIIGDHERVTVDGGHRRVLWSATDDRAGRVDFSVSWVDRDGWHVHATSRGSDSDITITSAWREGGGVTVGLRRLELGAPVELRMVDP